MSELHRIKCGNGNCYVIENGKSGVLVDTGKKEYLSQVLDACKRFHVRLLILTHAHFDHAENAAAIAGTLDVPIAMSESDCGLIADNASQSLSADTLPGKIVLSASLRDFARRRIPPFTPNWYLRDGDTLVEYGIDARIVSLPGHTDGSVGIDLEETHFLTGDALMNLFYPTLSMLYHDKAAMLDSAGKISGMGPRTIHFGHGSPVPNRRWIRRGS